MEDDMLKAQSKVIDILCNLEIIYPPAFFDIMIHLVIHLPLEALKGGPIRHRWMFPFERFMKKLKGYVRNKAKPECSIAEGYVAEEALTFSVPIWYVLHNSLEIDTYQSKFKSEYPKKNMKEEFPGWFGSQIRQRHVDNDPGVSTSSELFALACGPTPTLISLNSCVVNSVRFVVHNHDERRTTQNSGIYSPGGKDGEMYYGQLQEILEFSYFLNDLDFATLHIDGQSTDVDTPPDIIDVDEDDDITDDEDALSYDLADSYDEDLVNVDDDDGVDVVYSSEEED
ncbi:proton-dependent oligopeptide transporter family protein [Tanacetum coccineum]